MVELMDRIKKQALRQQFLIDTDTPEKLRLYLFKEYLGPIVREVTKINQSFYERVDHSNGYEIKILDRKIYVESKDNRTIFGYYLDEVKTEILEVYNYTTNARVSSKSANEIIDLAPYDLENFILQTLG